MNVGSKAGVSRAVIALVLVAVVAVSAGAYVYFLDYSSRPTSPLLVYSADLYTAESSYLYSGFSNSTGTPYATPKSAGSLALAAQIKAGSSVSVFISVSKAALESSYLGARAPGWGIAFVNDQMAIGYTNSSGQGSGFQTVLSDYQRASASNSSADWKAFFTDLTSGQ